MDHPLVSVICLCFNQERFVRESIESVLNQSYPDIELIIVDDASTDSSAEIIHEIVRENPSVKFVPLKKNIGNCAAFNKGFGLSQGAYIIDLAADDILLRERIERGVEAFVKSGEPYGVNFSDAEWINETGAHLYNHSDRFPNDSVPQGDVYRELISRFFICSPTVMFKREVMELLGGYDETLMYEDFDFWIRSSRKFFYCYTPEVLVKKRKVARSLSTKQFSFFSRHLLSTFRVCEKILSLNRNRDEQQALSKRIIYEFFLSARLFNFPVALKYAGLWIKNKGMKYR
jgi:glycosyltransferase involved in cell wall biosynthesis